MICPHCGKDNADRAAFCASCGKKLTYVEGGEADSSASPRIEAERAQGEANAPASAAVAADAASTSDASAGVPSVASNAGAVFIPPMASATMQDGPVEEPVASGAASPAGVVHVSMQPADEPAPAAARAAVPDGTVSIMPESPAASSVAQTAPATPSQAAPGPSQQSVPQPQATPQPSPTAYQQPAAAQAQPSATAQTSVPSAAGVTPPPVRGRGDVVYAKGCMGAAWSDITGSQGWFGKILLLGLINIVPILNWVVPGYAMRWSRKLSLGQIDSLPGPIFADRAFVNGAFAFVITLIVGVIGSIVGGIIGIVPILGWLASIFIMLFVSVFQALAVMRAAVADRLGAAFDLGSIWDAMKRRPGQMLCATLVPNLIVGAIVSVVMFFVCMIFLIPLIGDIAQFAQSAAYSSYYYDAYPYRGHTGLSDLYFSLHIIGLMLPMLLVCYVVGCFAEALGTVWTYRATGHYIARYAPEWSSLASVPYYQQR